MGMIEVPPIIPMGTWGERDDSHARKPRSRCFMIMEGAHTEYWYLSHLASLLSKRNLPERIEIVPIQKTGNDENASNPRALRAQAERIRADEDGAFGFIEGVDQIVMVFDADIYKGDEERYIEDLIQCERLGRVIVTSPSFELFLLLHVEGAWENIIEPHYGEILVNGYYDGSRRRFVSKLANEALGMNTKSNPRVALLAEHFEAAAHQEAKLNQDPRKAMRLLTSNVGYSVHQLIEEGASQHGLG